MNLKTKQKALLFLPVIVSVIDALIDFCLPTHPKINSPGIPYFAYLMLFVAGCFLVNAIITLCNANFCVKYYPKVKFYTFVVALLGLVQYLTDKKMALPKIYFPSINLVIASGISEAEMLLTCTLYSVRLLFLGIICGGIVGVLTGIVLGWNKKINYWVSPITRFVGPVPNAIWIPMSMLIFPSLFGASVFIVSLTMWFPTFVQTSSGIQNVSKEYYDVANTLGAKTWYQILRIAIPAAMPQIFIGLFSGITSCFISLMLAELMGSKYGIGWYINWKQQVMAYQYVWVAILIMAILCSITYKLLFGLRKRILGWQEGIIRW